MFRPRIIPLLLVQDGALVKTRGFARPRYIGDPLNAVRIFSDLRADELVFLDIHASAQGRCISAELVRRIGEEANMPFAVGGGIRTLAQIHELVAAGAEKVVLGAVAAEQPGFVAEAAAEFGRSTIVVCMDVRRRRFVGGEQRVYVRNGATRTTWSPDAFATQMEERGAGEIIVQSIDRDGEREGYDLDLVRTVSQRVTIPVIALGGAGSLTHLVDGYHQGCASAVAAGSLFVFHGKRQGVLLNYPEREARPAF